MSSYYPSFNYLGINSREKNLVVSHFSSGTDNGEVETFQSVESIYTEKTDGTRLDYGAKYNSVANFRITVIKSDGNDFSVKEVRENLKWLTGSQKNSPLDMVEHFSEEFTSDGTTTNFQLINTSDHIFNVQVNGIIMGNDTWTYDKASNSVILTNAQTKGAVIKIIYNRIKYSFIGRITNAWQYKMDARTVGMILEFTSTSPWAYSARQTVTEEINGETTIIIQNDSDNLYGYTPVNIEFANTTGTSLMITNNSTSDITEITNISANEIITMSNNMIIQSDKPSKIFGNTFNFVFQRLVAGKNEIIVDGTGVITFEYVCALKVGDCAMDINVISDPICNDDGEIILDTLTWSRISDTPTTFQGYGITNVYSKVEVNNLLADIQIDENELAQMLSEELK